MSLLKFLKSSTVEEVSPSTRKGGGARKQWNPAPGIIAIRVWKDGSIYPSQAAVDKFNLEYPVATISKEPIKLKEGETAADQKYRNVYSFPNGAGNGFDFIDSREWNQMKSDGSMLLLMPVPKDLPKVDLFNTVAYEEDGTAKISVMEQGAATFGSQVMLDAIAEVYGVRFNQNEVKEGDKVVIPAITDGVDWIDMAIFESIGEGGDSFNVTEQFSKPIIFAPKKVTRGEHKGKSDYVRREECKVYGFAPATEVIPGYVVEKSDTEEDATEEAKS